MENASRPASAKVKNGAFDARRAARKVRREFDHATHAAAETAEKFGRTAQRHPYVSAAVIFGTGMMLGAIAYRVIAPRPTAGGVIKHALTLAILSAGKVLANGVNVARRFGR